MTTDTISQTVLFPNLFDKLLLARFDQPHTSSDGGAVLLKAAEKVYGPVAGFVHCLVDRREPGKVGSPDGVERQCSQQADRSARRGIPRVGRGEAESYAPRVSRMLTAERLAVVRAEPGPSRMARAMALAGVTQTTPGDRGRLVSGLQQQSQIGQRDLETDSAGSNAWQYRKVTRKWMRYNGLQRGSRKTEGPRCGGHILNGRTAPATLDERSGSCRATSRRMGVSVPPRGTVARNAIKRGVTHERGATKPSVQVRIQVGLAHRKRQPGQQAVADAEVAGEGRTHRRSTMGVVPLLSHRI